MAMNNLKLLMPSSACNGKLFSLQTLNITYVIHVTTDFIIVLVTTKNREEAEKISQTLLQERLIACANIVSPVASSFLWQGKINCAEECMVVMKTRRSLFSELVLCVRALHSYEVPEVLALPIVEGSEAYLSWLGSVIR
jgi:periplasmic divalent cation tolerance protein